MTCAVSCGFDGLWVPLRSSKADMASIPGRGEPDRPEAALALLPTAGVLSVIRHMFPGRSCRVKPDERATRSTWNTQPCGPAAQDTPKAPDDHQKPRYARLVSRTARGCDERLEEPKARGCASLADGVRGEEARRGAVARGSCPGPVNTRSTAGLLLHPNHPFPWEAGPWRFLASDPPGYVVPSTSTFALQTSTPISNGLGRDRSRRHPTPSANRLGGHIAR